MYCTRVEAYNIFSALVSAAPSTSAPPAKFAIGITIKGVPTHYLGKKGDGYGVTDIKDAETCSITAKTELQCGNYKVGAISFLHDMVPLQQNTLQDITTGFSVDANNTLHWKNNNFSRIKDMVAKQNGEAQWALYPDSNGKKYQLYAQLGCPNEPDATHSFHQMMTIGTNKVVPL